MPMPRYSLPLEVGETEQWFAPGFDDSRWHHQRLGAPGR